MNILEIIEKHKNKIIEKRYHKVLMERGFEIFFTPGDNLIYVEVFKNKKLYSCFYIDEDIEDFFDEN